MSAYLDHAATTPLRPEARDAWLATAEDLGNASSVHGAGQRARRLLEEAREAIAEGLGCDPIEIVLTSGGTESINLALKGLWWARNTGDAIVLPDGEHHATMEAVAWLAATEGAAVRGVPIDSTGRIDASAWTAALSGAAVATALVANNEVGTIQDVDSLAAAAAASGTALHLDAVGAVGHVALSFARLRGDAAPGTGLLAMSVSGHKLGAPVGTGALVVSRHAALSPLVHGGGQQRGIRSGTQDVAGAAAMAAALTATLSGRADEERRVAGLRDLLWAGIHAAAPDIEMLGDPDHRLSGNLHLLLPGADGETMLFLLDQAGISVATGAACQAGVTEPSHVVMAMGRDERAARSVLRLTLGRTTTAADVDAVVSALPDAYRRASRARSGQRS